MFAFRVDCNSLAATSWSWVYVEILRTAADIALGVAVEAAALG